MSKKRLDYRYDKTSDVLTIEGQRYDGDFFREGLAIGPMPTGHWMRIIKSENGRIRTEWSTEERIVRSWMNKRLPNE